MFYLSVTPHVVLCIFSLKNLILESGNDRYQYKMFIFNCFPMQNSFTQHSLLMITLLWSQDIFRPLKRISLHQITNHKKWHVQTNNARADVFIHKVCKYVCLHSTQGKSRLKAPKVKGTIDLVFSKTLKSKHHHNTFQNTSLSLCIAQLS